MTGLRVLSVFGTRPEAIKMAPLVQALAQEPGIESRVCVTGQHRQMLDQVLSLFRIVPEYDLDLMVPGQDLAQVTTAVLQGLAPVLVQARPDLVLVHGDTTTTLASALACYYAKIPVGHVEAGLRTGNIYAPWPEEVNRRLTAGIARLHFAPTDGAAKALRNEAVPADWIHVTGNTVIDALQDIAGRFDTDPQLAAQMQAHFKLPTQCRIILVTGHRRESFGHGFDQICAALRTLADRPDVHLVYALHPNPRVRIAVEAALGGHPHVSLIEPQSYLSFVYLMKQADLILTDSGGIQEEAPSLGVPVLVMRDTTERPEALRAGTVRLVGTEASRIEAEVIRLLDNSVARSAMTLATNPFGDGTASQQIIEVLRDWARYG